MPIYLLSNEALRLAVRRPTSQQLRATVSKANEGYEVEMWEDHDKLYVDCPNRPLDWVDVGIIWRPT